MLKVFGLVTVLLSCIGGGVYSAYKIRLELYDLKETLYFVKYIKNRIEHLNSPLNEIYSTYKSENPRFILFLESLTEQSPKRNGIDSGCLCLSQKARDALKEMDGYLGKTQRKEQLNLLNYTIEILKNEYDILEKKTPEKTKLSVTLYIYAGLMLIILFL